MKAARAKLGITGFAAVKKGTPLYKFRRLPIVVQLGLALVLTVAVVKVWEKV